MSNPRRAIYVRVDKHDPDTESVVSTTIESNDDYAVILDRVRGSGRLLGIEVLGALDVTVDGKDVVPGPES